MRSGLATSLESIPDLRVFDYMPEHAVPPCAVVGFPESIEFDLAFSRGLDSFPTVQIYVFVGRAEERSAQRALSGYCAGSGTYSIKAAVETDLTASGAAETLRVERCHSFRTYPVGAVEMLGCIFDVRIYG